MKKVFYLLMINFIFALSGCGDKNQSLQCTMSQDAYIGKSVQEILLSFDNNLFKQANVSIQIDVDDDYKDYASTYFDGLKSEYKSLEKLYNIKYDIKENNYNMKVTYQLDFSLFQNVFGTTVGKERNDIISFLKTQGYSCK